MTIAKIWCLRPRKLIFLHDFGRVGENSEFLLVALTLKYIFAQEIVSEVNLVSSYACTKGPVHEAKNLKIHEIVEFGNVLDAENALGSCAARNVKNMIHIAIVASSTLLKK